MLFAERILWQVHIYEHLLAECVGDGILEIQLWGLPWSNKRRENERQRGRQKGVKGELNLPEEMVKAAKRKREHSLPCGVSPNSGGANDDDDDFQNAFLS